MKKLIFTVAFSAFYLCNINLAQDLPCPSLYIVSRAEWGARDPVNTPVPIPNNVIKFNPYCTQYSKVSI